MENRLIFKDKKLNKPDNHVLGISGENEQETLIFLFEDEFVDGTGYLEIEFPSGCCNKKRSIELEKDSENECYKLEVKNSLLRFEGTLKMQLKIVDKTAVWKSVVFEMLVDEAINATESIEDDYPDLVKWLKTRLQEIEEGFEQLDKKVNEIKIPTKLSELEDDSNFVKDKNYVHTDNNFTMADKEKLDGLKEFDDTEIRNELGEKTTLEEVRTVIDNRMNELVNGAPETFDTLKEIADYIAEHGEITNALNEAIGSKANVTDLEGLATKEYVNAQIGNIDTILSNIADESEAI